MSSVWIFGYGSLIFKVDFPYLRKMSGYITGFHRKFYQHSIDHRGTESKTSTQIMVKWTIRVTLLNPPFTAQPGRVVTLIPVRETQKVTTSKVFGVAYEIDPEVLKYLDYREKNGYERVNVQFYPTEDKEEPLDLIVYVATEDNCSFAGHKEIPELAEQVISATGPSGRNRDYVYNLAEAIRELFPGEEDSHLFALEREVRRQEAKEEEEGGKS